MGDEITGTENREEFLNDPFGEIVVDALETYIPHLVIWNDILNVAYHYPDDPVVRFPPSFEEAKLKLATDDDEDEEDSYLHELKHMVRIYKDLKLATLQSKIINFRDNHSLVDLVITNEFLNTCREWIDEAKEIQTCYHLSSDTAYFEKMMNIREDDWNRFKYNVEEFTDCIAKYYNYTRFTGALLWSSAVRSYLAYLDIDIQTYNQIFDYLNDEFETLMTTFDRNIEDIERLLETHD